MSKTLYTICVGGTGLRVMKSIIMLLASGYEREKMKDYTIVPVILDPHKSLDENKQLQSLIEHYEKVYKTATYLEQGHLGARTGFFSTPMKSISELQNEEDDTMNDATIDAEESRAFRAFIGKDNLPQGDINHHLINTLFSSTNLETSLSVGFKGNPNVGTVVLQKQVEGLDWFKKLNSRFQKGDRVFIISSIFGGTGASGFPLISKLIKESKNDALKAAPLGAITVFPYFKLSDGDKSNSDIDSSAFYTKAKSALAYYEDHLDVDYLYYIGDERQHEYENDEAKQKNMSHFIELVAATALFDFAQKPSEVQSNQYLARCIAKDEDRMTLDSMGDEYKPLVLSLANMRILSEYLCFLPTEKYFPLKRTHDFDSRFYSSDAFKTLNEFVNGGEEANYVTFNRWMEELRQNERSFNPFNNIIGDDTSDLVDGYSNRCKPNLSHYLLETIKVSHAKGNRRTEIGKFLDIAFDSINKVNTEILK